MKIALNLNHGIAVRWAKLSWSVEMKDAYGYKQLNLAAREDDNSGRLGNIIEAILRNPKKEEAMATYWMNLDFMNPGLWVLKMFMCKCS